MEGSALAKSATPRHTGSPSLNSLPVENKTLMRQLAVDAADRLQPHLDDTEAMQTYGMLHLSAGLTSAVCERPDDAQAHLAEATGIAARPGEGNFASMFFGPTNVGFWRTMIAWSWARAGGSRNCPGPSAPSLWSRRRGRRPITRISGERLRRPAATTARRLSTSSALNPLPRSRFV